MKDDLTPTETEYMAYLHIPRTTAEIMEKFDAKKTTVWQLLRTLRLKGRVVRDNGTWKIVTERPISSTWVTQYQRDVLEYLREPHKTTELMEHFTKSYQSAIQVIRTLRLMGYVESVETCGATGSGGCWFMWKTTEEGAREASALEELETCYQKRSQH